MSLRKRVLSLLLTAVMVIGTLPLSAMAAGSDLPFTDVSAAEWFYDGVKYAYNEGLIVGTTGTTFEPNKATTRAMVVTILYRQDGSPKAAASGSFTDVAAGSWYTDAIEWAAANDIVNGYGGGLFGPDDTITREQMATIIYRYSEYKGYDVDDPVSLDEFSDAGQVSSWAETAMKWAYGKGFITGTTAATLSPAGTATRAQIATIMMRFCENVKAYLEFEAKNVEDFTEYEIINFDESDETNFAALSEDTVVTATEGTKNRLVSADSENGVYVFENIDREISSLKAGDIFYHVYGTGAEDYILMKVGAIDINGTKATLTAGEAELSDLFEYIDLDLEIDVDPDSNAVTDGVSDTSADLAAMGFCKSVAPLSQSRATPASLDGGKSIEIGAKTRTASVTGKLSLKLNLKIKFDKKITDIDEIKLTIEQETEVTFKVTRNYTGEEDTFKKESPKTKVPVATGVTAEVGVYFVFDIDASVSGTATATYTSENGVKWTNEGKQDIRESDAEISVGIEGAFNVATGIGIEGGVVVAHCLNFSLTGEAGFEIDGKTNKVGFSTDKSEKHMCAVCVDGTIDFYKKCEISVAIGLEIGSKFKKLYTLFTFTPSDIKWEFKKFYISLLNDDGKELEFGWGECPHKQYLLNIVVYDDTGERVPNTYVEILDKSIGGMVVPRDKTNSDGRFSAYVSAGEYTVSASGPDGYGSAKEDITVSGKTDVQLEVEKDQESAPQVTPPQETTPQVPTEAELEKQIAAGWGTGITGAIDANGDLWVWNGYLKEDPVRAMTNVAAIKTSDSQGTLLAIQKDGSLWTVEKGDSVSTEKVLDHVADVDGNLVLQTDQTLYMWNEMYNWDKNDLVKVLDGVESICGDLTMAAIKTDGSLWMWGYNYYGQLGIGSDEHEISTPVKVMDDVQDVEIEYSTVAVIKKDGSLWMWGYNERGQVGIGSDEYMISTPVKVMDDVQNVKMASCTVAAIKKDSSLWMWGYNDLGQLGTKSDDSNGYYQSRPKKIMDDVQFVYISPYSHTAAIKTDGSLWTWGMNFDGQLGNGKSRYDDIEYTYVDMEPTKVLDNVAYVGGNIGEAESGGYEGDPLSNVNTIAVKTDGSLWMWGFSHYGDWDIIVSRVPVQISNLRCF